MKFPLRAVLQVLDDNTRRILPLIILSYVIVAALDAVGIGLVFPLVISMVDPTGLTKFSLLPAAFKSTNPQSALLAISSAVAVLFLVKNAASVLLLRWQYKVLDQAEARLGVRLFDLYLSAPWQIMVRRNSSELIRNASTSTSHVFLSFFVPGVTALVETLLALTVLGLLLVVDPIVAALATLLVGLAGVGYYHLVKKRLPRIGKQFQDASFQLLNDLKVGIGAGREIRVLERRAEFVATLERSRSLYAESQTARSVLTQIPRYYLECVLIIIMVSIILVASSAKPMSEVAPILAVFAVAFLRLMNSASRILSSVQQMRIGIPAVNVVIEEFGMARPVPPTAQESHGPSSGDPDGERGLCLRNISFAYEETTPILQDLQLKVNWGECIGIIGQSGSGKSTLFDLMLGLMQPTSGQIYADGVSISEHLPQWHRRIGYVPQSVYLADESLRRNIAFGIEDSQIDDEMVSRAINLAQLSEFVDGLNDGINTMVSEQGANLSGGQRQRIGIARALYHDPQILFLDEATSALDHATESQFVDVLQRLRGKKTIAIIAHRPSTLKTCDRIFEMRERRLHLMPEGAVNRLINLASESAEAP